MSLPDGWMRREFGEITSPSNRRCDPSTLNGRKRVDCIELEHLSQGDGRLLGTIDAQRQQSLKSLFEVGDVLFGKLRPYLRKTYLCDFNGVCSTEIWVFRANPQLCRSRFLLYLVQSDRFVSAACVTAGSKMPRADWDYVAEVPFELPPLDEQDVISDILECWDRALWQLSDLIAAKHRFRQGLTQQLLTGKRRFPEFQGAENTSTPLGDVLHKEAAPITVDPEKMYQELGIRSHGKGLFHKEPVLGHSLGTKRMYAVIPGCLTLNIVFAWERALAVTTERERGMVVSHRFPMFRPDRARILPEYVLQYLLSHKGNEALQLASPGGAGRNRTLSQATLLKTAIPLPTIEEQQKVVAFINTADREIDVLQRQADALKAQKRGLMRKLLTGEVRVKT